MENVLVAFVIIFIMIFGTMTLSEAMFTSQDMLQVSFQEMEARLEEQARTNLAPVDEPVFSPTNSVMVTFRNTGSMRLIDFDQWDVIVQYFDASDPANYHIDWLGHTSNVPFGNEWTVDGIYMDADEAVAEIFEPDILNTDEEIALELNVSPPVGPGQPIRILVSTPNGIHVSTAYVRNIPPELVNNLGLAIAHGETGMIDNTLLLSTDADNEDADLVYTVMVAPAAGTLTPASTFTQVDINEGLLSFTHDVSGDYSFQFTVSDGKDTIGPFVFPITVTNAEVVLAANTGLSLSTGATEVITSAMLNATDADDVPADLTYSVTTLPAQGTLNPGPVFSQEHIDAGLLSYSHTGSGSDSFEFTISDGENTIGPFTFQLSVS